MALGNILFGIPTSAERAATIRTEAATAQERRETAMNLLSALGPELAAAQARMREGKPGPTDNELLNVVKPQFRELADAAGFQDLDERTLISAFGQTPEFTLSPGGRRFRGSELIAEAPFRPTAFKENLDAIERLRAIPERTEAQENRLQARLALQERQTAVTGRTPEDIAISDPVRRRRAEATIQGNANIMSEISDLMAGIEGEPTAVGAVGATREVVGGLVGQVADLFDSEKLGRLASFISPDQLTIIRTKAATLRALLLPVMSGDDSRYSDRDMLNVENALRVMETTADSRQALSSLATIAGTVMARDRLVRQELKEGFGTTFMQQVDVGQSAPEAGEVFTDAEGNRAQYTGQNPDDPDDPVNWRELP